MSKLTLDIAQAIITGTLQKGRELGLKPLSAIVLDTGGHAISFVREDGAAAGRFAIAHGKAYGSIMLGMPGSAQMARAEQQAYFMNAINGVYGGQTVPVPGGVLIDDADGNLIGALGVTGDTSDNDVLAAVAGIEGVGLTARA